MKRNRVVWLVLALLSVTLVQNAQAFYNPTIGRWPNRDPINELGHLLFHSVNWNEPRQTRISTPALPAVSSRFGRNHRRYFGTINDEALASRPSVNRNADFLDHQFCCNDPMNRFDMDGRIEVPPTVKCFYILQGVVGLGVAAADWVIFQRQCMILADHPDEEAYGPSPGAAILTIVHISAISTYCPNGGRVYMHVWFDGKCNCKRDYVVICDRCSPGA